MMGGGTVLLVDDDLDAVSGLAELLEMEGVRAVIVSSPFELPFAVTAEDPDVILLDLSMPALTGESILRLGRNRVIKTDAVVLLHSGRSKEELSSLADTLGADGFLTKGSDVPETLRQISFWIHYRRSRTFATETLNENVA